VKGFAQSGKICSVDVAADIRPKSLGEAAPAVLESVARR
jgi:hypothetical protein